MAEETNNIESEVLEFEMPDFDVDFDLDAFDIRDTSEDETRYTKPRIYRPAPQSNIKYDNAVILARDLRLEPGGRTNVIVSGSFIFGDFIEAYIVEHNIKIQKMTISTLSMSQENVDSLANLINGGFVEELNLIISHYFFSHERHALIPYIYQTLDIDNRFQLAVAGTHAKTVIFDTLGGKKIVIHGSANLRSSSNLEQFTIEDNPELFDFYDDYQERIIAKYQTINKPVRVKPLWDLITIKKFR
ncbi:MAG: hypothetical protein NTZ69_15960 [Bacteroidia bacterium]|nr:hypothetical protein [Bacteroidia bacterium]